MFKSCDQLKGLASPPPSAKPLEPPPQRPFGACEDGFTLLEVLLTIVFLGIAVASLSRFFAGSNIRPAAYIDVAWATQLAEEKVEEIYAWKASQGYAAITTAKFPATPEDLTPNGYPGWTRETVFQYALVNALDGSAGIDGGFKRATVTVTWPGGSRALSALFTKWP